MESRSKVTWVHVDRRQKIKVLQVIAMDGTSLSSLCFSFVFWALDDCARKEMEIAWSIDSHDEVSYLSQVLFISECLFNHLASLCPKTDDGSG